MFLKATKCCEEESQNLVEVKLSGRTHGERFLEARSIATHYFCFWSTVSSRFTKFHPHHHHNSSYWYAGALLSHRKAEKQTLTLPWYLFTPLALSKRASVFFSHSGSIWLSIKYSILRHHPVSIAFNCDPQYYVFANFGSLQWGKNELKLYTVAV